MSPEKLYDLDDLRIPMGKRYEFVETKTLCALGTILDPRFKRHIFLNKDNLEKAKTELVVEIKNLQTVYNNEESPKQRQDKTYLLEPLLSPTANIFSYRKENMKYPNLRKFSRKFLIVLLQLPFRKDFSTSGGIVDKKKAD